MSPDSSLSDCDLSESSAGRSPVPAYSRYFVRATARSILKSSRSSFSKTLTRRDSEGREIVPHGPHHISFEPHTQFERSSSAQPTPTFSVQRALRQQAFRNSITELRFHQQLINQLVVTRFSNQRSFVVSL